MHSSRRRRQISIVENRSVDEGRELIKTSEDIARLEVESLCWGGGIDIGANQTAGCY